NPVTLQDQINFQAPLGLWGHVGEAATVRVAVSGVLSFQSVLVVVGASDPSGFMYTDGQGHQQGIYTFANYQLVTSGNPAHAGDVLIWWGTGLGKKQITPSQDGMPVMTADPTIGPVMVTVDGQAAKVLYAGSAPGILGLEQIDFQVPAGVTEGTQAVVVTAAQTAAQTTTYLPIAAAN
ncbi:MAG TPA: hypothetical protein VMT81_02000, partial [Candidatus Paceibacterota bacterium]|nr:hypothetical protein [Candidatus Paceibacterota bacterium]